MGRKSALTDKQWALIEKRLLDGEKAAQLAEEFGINRSQITRRFSQHIATVKNVANQIVAAEEALHALPVAQQLTAISLVDQMRSMMMNLSGAAANGAVTANQLSALAHRTVSSVNMKEPLDDEGREKIKDAAFLLRTANFASEIPLNILKANKEMVDESNRKEIEKASPVNPARGTVFKIIRPHEPA